jgi:hypothetical protein
MAHLIEVTSVVPAVRLVRAADVQAAADAREQHGVLCQYCCEGWICEHLPELNASICFQRHVLSRRPTFAREIHGLFS